MSQYRIGQPTDAFSLLNRDKEDTAREFLESIDPANPLFQVLSGQAPITNITLNGVPQLIKNATYTLTISEANYHLYKSDTSAYTWTIPANSSVAFDIGTCVTFVNGGSAGAITIAITTDVLREIGAGGTGSRTLAAYGMATAMKVAATTWVINGTGMT